MMIPPPILKDIEKVERIAKSWGVLIKAKREWNNILKAKILKR